MLLSLVFGLSHVDSVVLIETVLYYFLTLMAMSGAKSADEIKSSAASLHISAGSIEIKGLTIHVVASDFFFREVVHKESVRVVVPD